METEQSKTGNATSKHVRLKRLLAPREFRFRAWDLYAEKMLYNVEVNRNISQIEELDGYKLIQFTGLKDKNGKEIYEGDILLFDEYKYMVYWFEEMATFQLTNVEGGMDDYFESGNNSVMEIIGNIFENPELLE